MEEDHYKIGDSVEILNNDGEYTNTTFIGYYIYGRLNEAYRAYQDENGNIVNIDFRMLPRNIKIFDIYKDLDYYNYLREKHLPSTQETYRGFLNYLRYKRELRENPRNSLNIQRALLASQKPFDYEVIEETLVPRTARRAYQDRDDGDYFPDNLELIDNKYYWPEREIRKLLNFEDRINDGNLSFEDVQRIRRERWNQEERRLREQGFTSELMSGIRFEALTQQETSLRGQMMTEQENPSLREFSWVDEPLCYDDIYINDFNNYFI